MTDANRVDLGRLEVLHETEVWCASDQGARACATQWAGRQWKPPADVADADNRRGIGLRVKRGSGKERRVLADQLWAKAKRTANAVILDDYREWASTLEL